MLRFGCYEYYCQEIVAIVFIVLALNMAITSDSIKVEGKKICGCLVEVSLFLAGDDVERLLWAICGLTGMRRLPSVKDRLPTIRELQTPYFAWASNLWHTPLPKTGLFL